MRRPARPLTVPGDPALGRFPQQSEQGPGALHRLSASPVGPVSAPRRLVAPGARAVSPPPACHTRPARSATRHTSSPAVSTVASSSHRSQRSSSSSPPTTAGSTFRSSPSTLSLTCWSSPRRQVAGRARPACLLRPARTATRPTLSPAVSTVASEIL